MRKINSIIKGIANSISEDIDDEYGEDIDDEYAEDFSETRETESDLSETESESDKTQLVEDVKSLISDSGFVLQQLINNYSNDQEFNTWEEAARMIQKIERMLTTKNRRL